MTQWKRLTGKQASKPDYAQARVSRLCLFIHYDRVAQLDILLVVVIVAFVSPAASKLATAIHHWQYTASHQGYYSSVGGWDRDLSAKFQSQLFQD